MYKEPTLADMIKSFWKARFYVATSSVIFLVIAIALIVIATPLYRASMIVAPADGYALGDYASTLTEGQSLEIPFWRPKDQEGVSTDFYRFIYTTTGTSVAAFLLKDQSVIAGIAKDGQWKHGAGEWSAEELAQYLQKNLKIEHLGTTPLRRISYSHPDAVFAAALLRKVHLVSDQLIRRDRRRQSETRIDYLQGALQKTINPDHRKGIANLLVQQEHIKMLANLDEPYAAIVVEPSASAPKPVWPNKPVIIIIFVMMGAVIGYLVWSARSSHEQ